MRTEAEVRAAVTMLQTLEPAEDEDRVEVSSKINALLWVLGEKKEGDT